MDTNETSQRFPEVYEVADVARDWKISRTIQWHLRKRGALPFRQAPGSTRVYYLREDLEAYFASIRRGGKAA